MAKNYKPSSSLLLGHIELTKTQKTFFETMIMPSTRVVFLRGPAGSSKTFLATYTALTLLNKNPDTKILYLRSVIESASQSLGFLKGDMDDKFGPYMAPLEDKIDELLTGYEKDSLKRKNSLEAQPINFQRGQSWRDKVVIIDEAQNMTKAELTTLLTRIGRETKVFVCGDTMQSDIRSNDFARMCDLFDGGDCRNRGIFNFAFSKKDIMRDKILSFIIDKIEKSD
jgi:phosphate starvation-inducible PhoH-like protein|tara:strand:- start:709 stop:1386 length:678 start_codon:yes stop_codon:yes gene_type:complete